MMRTWLALLVVACALIAAVRARKPPESALRSVRAHAQQLNAEAAEAHSRLQADSAFELLVVALEADPTYTPALFDLLRNPRAGMLWKSVLARVEPILARDPNDAARECRIALLQRPYLPTVRFVPSAQPDAETRECSRFHR